MAKYSFKCKTCGKAQQRYVGPRLLELPCDCGSVMVRQMPKTSHSTTYEKPDKDSGSKWIEDQPNVLQARKEKYFWEVEVPRLVASGIYSAETMIQNGWVSISDDGKITVNIKPPSQR